MENASEKVIDGETEQELISGIDEAIGEVLDSSKQSTDEPTPAKRRNHPGCEDCDIPFNTKKELKVSWEARQQIS